MHEASRGRLKGAVSAQTAFQGSETGDEGVAERNEREQPKPWRGVID